MIRNLIQGVVFIRSRKRTDGLSSRKNMINRMINGKNEDPSLRTIAKVNPINRRDYQRNDGDGAVRTCHEPEHRRAHSPRP